MQKPIPFLDNGRLVAGRARPQSARERLDLRLRLRGAIRYGLRHCSRVAVVVTYPGLSGVVVVCRESSPLATPDTTVMVVSRPASDDTIARAYEECMENGA